MSIRKYNDTDREAVIEIWYAASLVATPFLSDEFLTQERENIRNLHLPNAETWVYEIAGHVVGFIAMLDNEVGAIFVHPGVQGSGVGRALMDHAASTRDSLYLDVFKENAIGRRFYDRSGFKYQFEHVQEETGRTQMRLAT